MAQSGYSVTTASNSPMAPATRRQSGFMMSTTGAVDAAMPWFTPRPKPTFCALRSNRTCGANASAMAALPSLDALSTTTASHTRPWNSSAIDCSARRSSLPAL